MKQQKKIAFVGAGNVAWSMAQALLAAGHEVISVYSRTSESREQLCKLLPKAKPAESLDMSDSNADIIIIAVPDAALDQITTTLKVKQNVLVVHTSGSRPLTVLESIRDARIGVFYPLQTFSKTKQVDFLSIPILIEAIDDETLLELKELALSICSDVHEVVSQTRKQLHLSAVFACNFTNHLLGISRQLLNEANLPIELLHPLIQETVTKASLQNPYNVQTGPAIRYDDIVIQEHIEMLKQHPRFQELYKALTSSIQNTSSRE